MTEWPVVALGELTSQSREAVRVDPSQVYPMLGVRWYAQGAFHRETVTPKAGTIYRVRPGQFIYNRLFAWKGSFGLVTEDLAGSFVSNEFPLFACDPGRLLPEYLIYVFGRPEVWSRIERVSTGTTASRNRWNEPAFNAYEVALPSLQEQRRIIAVMAVVDTEIEALEREVEVASLLMERVLAEAMQDLSSSVTYGMVATTRSGSSWAADDETKTPVDGSVKVVKITNTKSDGSLDLSDETYVLGLPDSTATLDAGSLIIIRTNGNRSRIGNVYRAAPAVYGCAVSAFQFLSRANDPADRDFLYWALREPSMQQRMSEAASGSTGLGNLAVKWLNTTDVPWSDDEAVRADVVARLDSTQATVERLAGELAALRTVRADLLTALLSQEITIEAAVDEFVKAA